MQSVWFWIREHHKDGKCQSFRGNGKLTPEQKEISKLKSQVEQFESEKPVFKAAMVFFIKETK